jgi:hypothetical protein
MDHRTIQDGIQLRVLQGCEGSQGSCQASDIFRRGEQCTLMLSSSQQTLLLVLRNVGRTMESK